MCFMKPNSPVTGSRGLCTPPVTWGGVIGRWCLAGKAEHSSSCVRPRAAAPSTQGLPQSSHCLLGAPPWYAPLPPLLP